MADSYSSIFNISGRPSEEAKRAHYNMGLSGHNRFNTALNGYQASSDVSGHAGRQDELGVLQQFAVLSDDMRARYVERLDAYEEALGIAEAEALTDRAELLAKAYLLPDGTHIFFSADGATAIDEHGNPVEPKRFETVPREVRRRHNTMYAWQENLQMVAAISAAREELSNSRLRFESPHLNTADLNSIDGDLLASLQAATSPYAAAARKLAQVTNVDRDVADITELTAHEVDLINNGLVSSPRPMQPFNEASIAAVSIDAPADDPHSTPHEVPFITP